MLKKLGIALLVVLMVVALALGWLWMRLTALPDWYEDGDLVAEDGSPRVDREWVEVPRARRPKDASGAVYELRNPHLRPELGGGAGPLAPAIKASRAIYDDAQIEAGAVVNLEDADLEQLAPAERERFDRIVDAFPALTGRDVYIGVEGGVRTSEGTAGLGPDAQLRVGDTRYDLAKAASRMGVSEAELRRDLEAELRRLGVSAPPAP